MRLKKGFTLAEVLIVLMVIGAIATLTIPSLMRGVQESQWKTAYKKAYNTVVNITAMERVSGQLPAKNTPNDILIMFKALNSSLSVKDYVLAGNANDGDIPTRSDFEDNVDTYLTADPVEATVSPWINTDDGLAYQVLPGTGAGTPVCNNKSVINAQTSTADAMANSCVVVYIDVNGLTTGPNTHEEQEGADGLLDTEDMQTLTGDRYYVFISKDGAATSGSKKHTITGRIASDIK